MAKYPNRGPYGRNSRIALSNLQKHFDYDGWRISRTREVENEAEFGKDWLLSLSNETGDVLSQECTVQSKVISSSAKLKKDYIFDNVETTTINYLRGLPELVLLHFYDAKAKIGYVRWLDEWLNSKDCPPNWSNQDKVRIKISRSSILDSRRVNEITKRLITDGQERELARLVNSINQTHGSVYRVGLDYLDTDKLAITLDARSLINTPIIHLPKEDQWELFRKAAITGKPQTLTSSVKISNIPPQLGLENREFEGAIVYLREDLLQPEFHTKIEFFDQDNNIILKSSVVPFKRVKKGIPALVFGVVKDQGIRYVIEVSENKTNLSVVAEDNDQPWHWPENVIFRQELGRKLSAVTRARVTHLETEKILLEQPFVANTGQNEYVELAIRLAQNLIVIREKTGIELLVPRNCSMEEIELSGEIADILKTGRHQGLLAVEVDSDTVLIIEYLHSEVANFRQIIKENNGLVVFDGPVYIASLFGREINLGRTKSHFSSLEIVSEEPIDKVSNEGDKLVKLIAKFSLEDSFVTFDEYYTDH